LIIAVIAWLIHWPVANAGNVTITLAELDAALVRASDTPDSIQQLVLEHIQLQLDEADLRFQQGEVLYEQQLSNVLLQGGCNSTLLERIRTDVRLTADTALSLTVNTLQAPVSINFDVRASIGANGRAQQSFGVNFNGCQRLGHDTFDFNANGQLHLALTLNLQLNPEFTTRNTLRVRPNVSLDGRLVSFQHSVNVEGSVLRSRIEDQLQAEISAAFAPARIRAELVTLQNYATQQLAEAVPGGFLEFEFPELDAEQVIALQRLLAPDARFPLTLDYVQQNRFALLAALLLNDQHALSQLLGNAAACEAGGALRAPLQRAPLYIRTDAGCVATQADNLAGPYYSDNVCRRTVAFIPTSLADFCNVALDPASLGNAAASVGILNHWSFSPGTQLDITALSVEGKRQPFTQRVHYKTVATEHGVCELAMRVYSIHPTAQGQKALIAFHGGSWQQRANGFLGIESMATHFVNAGFVVYAPFYRLIGDDDGNAECHNASLNDALTDAADALDWVQSNGSRFGTQGKPVVFGQSAGGHLAASLAVSRAEDIERAVLLYAPTDFRDFAARARTDADGELQGRRVLQSVIDTDINAIDLNSPLLLNNSFPTLIAAQPDAYPPIFLLHGEADSLLPFRQSVRLCNAMSGNPESGLAPFSHNLTSLRRLVRCDARGSELHLIAEGEHSLDVCIDGDACFAGSADSASIVADSLQRMLRWMAAE